MTDPIKCLKQINYQKLLLTRAPFSELPSNSIPLGNESFFSGSFPVTPIIPLGALKRPPTGTGVADPGQDDPDPTL